MNVAIIQARMGSKRLPGKVLRTLEDKTILEHIVSFLKLSQNIDDIIIATTILPEDCKIDELAKKMDVKCFRGSSDNVLERFYKCAKNSGADIIIRITADDPIVDPTLIDRIIAECVNENLDYASNVLEESYPLGYSTCEVFTFETLSKLYHNQNDPDSLEHVTYYIRQNPELFKTKSLTAPEGLQRPNWRLTIDYEQDFELMKKIFSEIHVPEKGFEYEELVKFLDKNQELLEINKGCK